MARPNRFGAQKKRPVPPEDTSRTNNSVLVNGGTDLLKLHHLHGGFAELVLSTVPHYR